MRHGLPQLIKVCVWGALGLLTLGPIALMATSPYLPARAPVYIAAGVAGAVALAVLLVQPLLAGGYLPGARPVPAKRWHRLLGSGLLLAVAVHIGGLYLTSPPDARDALLLVSPTPFSVYGVMAMWALIATAMLVGLRPWLGLRPGQWRILHNLLVAVVVLGSVVHALLIEGTMETTSKWLLCAAIALVTTAAFIHLRIIKSPQSRR